jgi:hypothetical protein
MATWKIEMTKQVDDSWILENFFNDLRTGATPVPEDFEIVQFDFEAALADASNFSGFVDDKPIQNNLVYLGQQAVKTIPRFSVEISKKDVFGDIYIYFALTRADGWVQEAEQIETASSIVLCMSTTVGDTGQLVADSANSTVDFYFYPIEPRNPQQVLIDIYENVDGTWQAIVTLDETEILNDDYPSEELAHQAAQAAVAAL